MKRTLLALALIFSANVYGQNGQQKVYFPQVFFDKNQVMKQMQPGSSSISGEAYANDPMGNGTSYARNSAVFLIPYSDYFAEWLALTKKFQNSGHQVYLHPDVIATGRQLTTDEYGNFRFDKLKPGKYYLETIVDYQTSEVVTKHTGDVISAGPYGVNVTPIHDYYSRKYTAQKKAATVVEITEAGQHLEIKLKPEMNLGILGIFRSRSGPGSTLCYQLRNRLYGTCKEFHANGNLRSVAEWEKDLHGDYKEYDPQGNVLSEGQFEHGKMVGIWSYHENGSKTPARKERYTYQGDKVVLHGDLEFFFPSGRLRAIEPYVNGLREGEAVLYHENGKVWQKITYRNGQMHGPFAEYDEQGNLKAQGTFEKGKFASGK